MSIFSRLKATVCLLLLVTCCHLSSADTTSAAQSTEQTAVAKEYKHTINTILEDKAFHEVVTTGGWRLKDLSEENKREEVAQWLIALVEFMEKYFGSDNKKDSLKPINIAGVIEVILWIVFIIVIFMLCRHFKLPMAHWLSLSKQQKTLTMPSTIAGLNVSKASLPENIVLTATNLWKQNQYRDAVSLLYRASLSRILHEYDCQLLSSYTEQECLSSIKQLHHAKLNQLMSQLTRHWQQLAYRHCIPSSNDFYTLCELWDEFFSTDNKEEKPTQHNSDSDQTEGRQS